MVQQLQHDGYAEEAKRIVLLRGCHLNNGQALRRLSSIFQGFEDLDEGPPALFVFIGPFFEFGILEAPRNAADMRMGFSALAAIVSVFPNIQVCLLFGLSAALFVSDHVSVDCPVCWQSQNQQMYTLIIVCPLVCLQVTLVLFAAHTVRCMGAS
jgi:hypothetical protein